MDINETFAQTIALIDRLTLAIQERDDTIFGLNKQIVQFQKSDIESRKRADFWADCVNEMKVENGRLKGDVEDLQEKNNELSKLLSEAEHKYNELMNTKLENVAKKVAQRRRKTP